VPFPPGDLLVGCAEDLMATLAGTLDRLERFAKPLLAIPGSGLGHEVFARLMQLLNVDLESLRLLPDGGVGVTLMIDAPGREHVPNLMAILVENFGMASD
jgi:hypothetical protein